MNLLHRHDRSSRTDRVPSAQEIQITRGLQTLRDATARDVMTPRVDVVALPAPVSLTDVISAVRRSGRSHFPVYDGDLDRLRGVLFVKDILTISLTDTAKVASADLSDRVRDPYVIPESRSALEILSEMRRGRRGFAVVVDEHGGFAGVLTVNDLVSELVGDLHDEYDRAASPSIVRIDRNRYLVDGSCAVVELRDELGLELPDGEYVTLAGFLLDRLGHIPEERETVEAFGWTFRITKVDRRRIAKVVLESPSATIPVSDQDEGRIGK
jgi:CBS domain containing-hemolysin-like protein